MHIEQISPYLTWRIRQKVMYPGYPLSKVILEDDEEGMHFGLFEDGSLLSVISLFRRSDSFQFRKFATIQTEQGKGYGTALLTYVLKIAKTEGGTRIWCNARRTASNFYTKFGFSETPDTFQKSGHEYVVMEKLL